MESIVRTVYGAALQSSLMLGLPYSIPQYTTLNEKLNINPTAIITPGAYPDVKYYCIGNGGHSTVMGTNNTPLITINQHLSTDAALFNQLPFVLRTLANDLLPEQRTHYALRLPVTINSVNYIAYYLRRVDLAADTIQMQYRVVNGGVTTTTPFVPDNTCLNPTPIAINSNGVNSVSGNYITCTSQFPISLSAADMVEFINVATIMYGDPGYAIISEIGLCSGVDKLVSVTPPGGVAFNFMEAIGVQIVSHISAMHMAEYNTTGLTKTLDVGSNLPLYSLNA